MGEIKIVKKIVLPLVVGQALVFYSKDGAKLQTFPKRIDGIICRTSRGFIDKDKQKKAIENNQ